MYWLLFVLACNTVTDLAKLACDQDGDGYVAAEIANVCESELDCDDSNSMNHPDAEEICDDSADNNCDGTVDEEPCRDAWQGSPKDTADTADSGN